MIADQTGHFLRWLEGRTIVPTIAALHGHHDGLRTAELERAKKSLANGAAILDHRMSAQAQAFQRDVVKGHGMHTPRKTGDGDCPR